MDKATLAASAIIGLRETLEIALLISIILITARKKNPQTLQYIVVPTILALVAGFSIGLASYKIIISSLESWIAEATSYLLAAAIILWVAVWSSTSGKNMVGKVNEAGNLKILGLLTFIFVAREALEISLMTLPLAKDEPIAAITGLATGSLASALIAFTIYSYGVRMPIGKFFAVMGVTLVLIGSWMTWEAMIEIVEGLSILEELEELLPLTVAFTYAVAAYLLIRRQKLGTS
ncbi:MAG: FTR1 family protein [Desulfurococcales archaeon]|nr:FTR1 family protein [Aeropyrum sp.]MCE4628798.1 FTR1 family protein [Desulfurococcales archaeon]